MDMLQTTEREEGGATIYVCTAHLLEYCGRCCCDYTDMNADARHEAAARYGAADALSPAADFTPRTISVGYDGRQLVDLAPGTRLVQHDWSGRQPPKGLKAVVLSTVWEGNKAAVESYLDPTTNEPMPCYLLEYEEEDGSVAENAELVLCCDVHDELEWKVLEAPARQAAGGSDDDDDDDKLDDGDGSGSVATSCISAHSTRHATQRFMKRGIVKRQFQAALKHVPRNRYLPGLPSKDRPTWLLIHGCHDERIIFCTDADAKVMISAFYMMKPNEIALAHHLQDQALNEKRCRLIRFSDKSGDGILKDLGHLREGMSGVGRLDGMEEEQDGHWYAEFLDSGKRAWVPLCSLKPPPVKQGRGGPTKRGRG